MAAAVGGEQMREAQTACRAGGGPVQPPCDPPTRF